MHVIVTEAHLEAMSTVGTASGYTARVTEDGNLTIVPERITFGMDHRPLRALIEALHEQGPVLTDNVESWAVLDCTAVGVDELSTLDAVQELLDFMVEFIGSDI